MIINKLKMNLSRCTVAPTIDAVQGDVCSRILEIALHSGKKPFLLPENLAVLIRYKKADGRGGEYDTLPDGSSAWSCQGNLLYLTLAPQVLTCPGSVFMTVTLITQGKQLSTFPVRILVQPAAQPLLADSEDYFNITGFLTAPGNAKIGQYLQVTSVDESGRVTEIAAADASFPENNVSAPADWEAAEGEPGHILNRPFFSEFQYVTFLEPVTLTASEENDNAGILPEVLEITEGTECTITYNGVPYNCTAASFVSDGIPFCCLGNQTAIGGSDSGEPFFVMAFTEEYAEVIGVPGLAVPLDGSQTFTISISGNKETVYPVQEKYLAAIRCQKKILLDLDAGTSSISISQTAEMDTGELQTAISALYKGTEHSVIILNRKSEEYEGKVYHTIEFLISHESSYSGSLPGISTCVWDNFSVNVRTENTLVQPFSIENSRDACILVKLPNDANPHWRKITATPFESIILKSSSASSARAFELTVDDNGTLSVTEVSL